ncbi:hypothetical protein SAMN04488128_1011179 [Chitinophaga eiseniae]|uniref:Uncharacterized protein n=1 Tax=Chitinophaga eiseniae TaxID=634771 RepID=A0A1T4MN61_9BACT|nr:hypothetical protein [Chitinophaga eiseniae]SJZ68224.1 hypothetical protein SAMN04488128_1011179 [Chitinophaga eiseniae]
MLSSFSWASYLMVAALIIGIYYCVVIARYFRRDIKRLSRQKTPPEEQDDDTYNPQLSLFDNTEVQPDIDADLFTDALGLSARIREVLSKAARENYSKAGLILILKKLVAEYPSLKGTAFQRAVNNVVIVECRNMGAAGLNEDEVDLLW